MAPVAEQLLADVEELRAKVKTVDLQAVQIANGANELLGEVSASKITGEEERYSHIDLVDFEANVEGAEAAFDAVEPLLDTEDDPELAEGNRSRLRRRLRLAEALPARRRLRPLHRADQGRHPQAGAGIDSLAEKLAEMPAQIAGGEADADCGAGLKSRPPVCGLGWTDLWVRPEIELTSCWGSSGTSLAARAAGGGRRGARRARLADRDADRRRQEPLLPAAGAGLRRT